MTKQAKDALEKIRTALADAVAKLPPHDYIEVCEELSVDLDGRIEAAKEEEGDE